MMYRVMVRLMMPLVTVVYMTPRVLASLVMSMVRVLPVVLRVFVRLVMPMVRALQVMQWLMVPLAMLILRVLQVILSLTVPLVMRMVRVFLVMVLGVGPRVAVVGGSECGLSPFLAEGLAGDAGRLASRSWQCWSCPLSGRLLAIPGGGCR